MTESDERTEKFNEATRARIASTKPKTLDLEQQIADDTDYGFVTPNQEADV